MLVPGIKFFFVLLIASVAVRSLPTLLLAAMIVAGFGALPIAFIVATAFLSFFYWRRHWISGISIICAAFLVLACWLVPNPVNSPVGWSSNGLKIMYYHRDLRASYERAKKDGQLSPVGQVYTDGFGSLTSGLAYDPSREIALPADQRSKAWKDGPGSTELGIESVEAHHIFGPYYQFFHP